MYYLLTLQGLLWTTALYYLAVLSTGLLCTFSHRSLVLP
jgi:hypothetical protein